MSAKKGFTLIEIIVVTIIIGILAVVAVPTYYTFMQQGASKAAQNNLVTIYNGQKTYYLSSATGGTYYNSPSANDLAGINTALGLNINDNNFQYTCTTAAGPSYTCTATNNSDTTLVLTITSGTPNTPNLIVLPGGVNCPGVGCNPICADTNAKNCPN